MLAPLALDMVTGPMDAKAYHRNASPMSVQRNSLFEASFVIDKKRMDVFMLIAGFV